MNWSNHPLPRHLSFLFSHFSFMCIDFLKELNKLKFGAFPMSSFPLFSPGIWSRSCKAQLSLLAIAIIPALVMLWCCFETVRCRHKNLKGYTKASFLAKYTRKANFKDCIISSAWWMNILWQYLCSGWLTKLNPS